MELDQGTSEVASPVIGQEDAAPRAPYVEQHRSAEQRHFKNMCGSELLLRRLRQNHFDHAPEHWKRRFLPVVPMNDILVEEYKKLIAAGVIVPDHREYGPAIEPELAEAMYQAEKALLYYQRLPIKLLVAVVSRYFGLRPTEIVGNSRFAKAMRPRQIVYYLARDIGGWSFPEIGKKIGYRDHTTILHGYRKITRLMQSDATLAAQVTALRAQVCATFETIQKAA